MADFYVPMSQQPDEPEGRLTEAEDAELRRLYYMSQTGTLSERCRHRLQQLRKRDRRQTIRTPKEFEADAAPEKQSLWRRLSG